VVIEKQFLAQVKELADLFGWKLYHPFLSKFSARGWPDVALLRGDRLLLIELKTETGQPTPEQAEWLELLEQVPGVEAYLWKPSDFDDIAEILRRNERP